MTPAKLTLTRSESYTATFTKPDFPERIVKIEPRPSWWLAGNLIFGGLIGLIIDLATGSGMTLSPDAVHMDLATGSVSDVIEASERSGTRAPGNVEFCRQTYLAGRSDWKDHMDKYRACVEGR